MNQAPDADGCANDAENVDKPTVREAEEYLAGYSDGFDAGVADANECHDECACDNQCCNKAEAMQEYANAKFEQEVEDLVQLDRDDARFAEQSDRLDDLSGLFLELITSDADTIVVRRDDEANDYVIEATFRV